MLRRRLLQLAALLGAAIFVPTSVCLGAPPDPEPAETITVDIDDDNWPDWGRDWRPALGLQYGFADPSREDFGGDFGPAGQIDLRIGYVRERRLAGQDDLLVQSSHGVVASRFASAIASQDLESNEVGLDTWRFGFGTGYGAGYRFRSGDLRLVLVNSNTGGWYFTDLEGAAVRNLAPADSAILDSYDSATRWGDSWEGMLRLGITGPLSVQASYERTVVQPGFKIWYWMLSHGIDLVALALADEFVDAVEDASPHAAPVVAFLLRGGIQYGFYELRQAKMNWPFETEAPLAFDSFKLGFGVAF